MTGKRIVGFGILVFGGGWCLYVVIAFTASLVAAAFDLPIPITPLVWIMLIAMLGLPICLVGWIVEQFEEPSGPTLVRGKEKR